MYGTNLRNVEAVYLEMLSPLADLTKPDESDTLEG